VANVIRQTGNYQLLYILCGVFVSVSVLFWIFVREPESTKAATNVGGGGH
jgi:hypothetical protein